MGILGVELGVWRAEGTAEGLATGMLRLGYAEKRVSQEVAAPGWEFRWAKRGRFKSLGLWFALWMCDRNCADGLYCWGIMGVDWGGLP